MFGRFDGPGQGVSKDAPKVRDFFLFFELYGRKFWTYCMLGLIYTACMILFLFASYVLLFVTEGTMPEVFVLPTLLGMCIFTPGLTYVLRNFSWEKHSWYIRDFFRNVWTNLKQSMLLFVCDALVAFVLITAIQTYIAMNQLILVGMCVTILLFVVMMHLYIYVIMVTFNMKFTDIIKNAFKLTVGKLPVNILLVICAVLTFWGSFMLKEFAYAIVTMLTVPFVGLMLTFYPARVIKKLMVIEENKVKTETLFDDDVQVNKLRR